MSFMAIWRCVVYVLADIFINNNGFLDSVHELFSLFTSHQKPLAPSSFTLHLSPSLSSIWFLFPFINSLICRHLVDGSLFDPFAKVLLFLPLLSTL